MEKEKLHIGAEEIRNMNMTADEKKLVFQNIMNPAEPRRLPLRSSYIHVTWRVTKNSVTYFRMIVIKTFERLFNMV